MTWSHKYDDPTLSAKEFLIAIMRDPTLSLEARQEAARILLNVTDASDFPAREPAVIYRIEDFRDAP
jgi:hypothetical protein